MSNDLQHVLEAALQLSPRDRAELVVRLFDTLPEAGLGLAAGGALDEADHPVGKAGPPARDLVDGPQE